MSKLCRRIGRYAVYVEENEAGGRHYFIVGPSGARIGRNYSSLAEAEKAAEEIDRQHGYHEPDDADTDDDSGGSVPASPRG